MKKVGPIIVIVSIVCILYLILIVVMPTLVDFTLAANATLNATSNMSQYPGTSEALIAAPWVLYFVPAVIGMVFIVIILKKN